jgi:hypothetical protein
MEEAETEAAKAALDEAVSKATGTTGDRLERLREALKAVGGKADRVRLVRVFSGEEPVQGATKIGEHYYIVDLMPQSMKQEFKTDDRAGGGGARRGPRRPSGGGSKGKEGSLEGSFSMESVLQDRKNERPSGGGRRPGGPGGGRGRPGGGRGPGGGGRGPGGGGGGRPGGGRSGPPKGP